MEHLQLYRLSVFCKYYAENNRTTRHSERPYSTGCVLTLARIVTAMSHFIPDEVGGLCVQGLCSWQHVTDP